jgi:MoaA/NifB/PqqE/SkfB family radical SAM enzyme
MEKANFNRYGNQNYVEKLLRLYDWSNNRKPHPFKIAIIPTNRCNLNCFFCPNSVARSSGRFDANKELTEEDWLRVVDEGLELDVREWRFLGGGEPLLRYKTVIKMIERIKSHPNTDCEIITNGTLFNENDITNLVKLKFDRIIFSVHGPTVKSHNFHTGSKNSFQLASRNILLFQKFKKIEKSDKPIIQINTVLTNKNYRLIPKMIEFAVNVGCNELALHPLRLYKEIKNQAKFLQLNEKERRETAKLIEKTNETCKDKNLILDTEMLNLEKIACDGGEFQPPFNSKKFIRSFLKMRCFEPWYGMLIDPEGNVAHCVPHGMGNKKFNVKTKLLKDIWLSSYFMSIRKKILNGSMMKSCYNCGLIDMSNELRTDLNKFIKWREKDA